MVGTSISSKTFGPQMSKVIRLNQVSARSAAEYLGNLGASFNLTHTATLLKNEPEVDGSRQARSEVSQVNSSVLKSTTFGSSIGPLRGLVVTTDERLSSVTLVGDSQLVSVAENYIRQIDLRQRQVALCQDFGSLCPMTLK